MPAVETHCKGNARPEHMIHDLRYAFRTLRRTPAFTIFAIATLALGIGASTITFTIVDAVLLKPLPFADPEQLATIQLDPGARVSERYAYEWRSQSKTIADLAGWYDARMILSGRGEPVEVLADRTTPNFFAVLGTRPILGRTFSHERDLTHVDREVVLSYGLWQRRFGGESRAIGESITLDDASFTIVGVMPASFAIRTNELPESRAELWTPFHIDPDAGVGMGGSLNVVARLADNTSFAEAQVEVATIANRLEAERPSFTRNWRVQMLPLREATVRNVRATILVLFGSVSILLLIACVNVATLLLSRSAARSTEVALRISLGATVTRLMHQFLCESILLAAGGGVIGLTLATWGTRLGVNRLSAMLDLPRAGHISVDYRAVVFAIAATTLTAIVFGVFPALRAIRIDPHDSLQEHRTASPRTSRRHSSNVLLATQIALALTLLTGAGLLARSFEKLTRVDLGFRPSHVVTMRTTLSPSRYASDDRVRAFTTELLTRAASIAGVQAVGLANYLPLSNIGEGTTFEIEGRSPARPEEKPSSWRSVVGGRYFETMGIPLLRGRLPGSADTDRTQPVAVIDEVLARRYWPSADPIGTRLRFKNTDGGTTATVIIGVIGNVRWMTTAAEPPGTTYLWSAQSPGREIMLAARVSGNTTGVAKELADTITDIDPGQPAADIRTLEDLAAADTARPRVTMLLLTGFATAAIVLAAIGLYSVISFNVLQRRREIGVRMALGAQRGDVLRLFMSRGLVVTAAGVVVGIACALALGRVLGGLLYGIESRDLVSIVAATSLVLLVATLAIYVPAARATRLDPVVALRRE
jgi:putative ABC transport system permease protein